MKKWLIVIVLAIGVLAIVLVLVKKQREDAGVDAFYDLMGKPYHVHTTRPLQQSELGTNAPVPFPIGASNIQYAAFKWWQAWDIAVRYEASASECIEHGVKLLEKQKHSASGTIETNFLEGPIDFTPSVQTVTSDGKTPNLDLSWFDLQNFSSGLQLRLSENPAPAVWVDTNRGVFYYNDSD